jgi:flagellar biosynthesis chaperone FliJ
MKTRFSSLVSVKKNSMQKSEIAVQSANNSLNNANNALENAFLVLQQIKSPLSGKITELFASRVLLDTQRNIIKEKQEWITFAEKELVLAKERLKSDMIEYEKFKYLELQEINAKLKEIKIKEAKDLDEIALITHAKNNNRVA